MIEGRSETYINGFLDGAITITLASCRNENNYELSALYFNADEEMLPAVLSEALGCEGVSMDIVPSEKSFYEICEERFGNDRKSRRAISGFEDMLIRQFGRLKGFYAFKEDADICDSYSGYSGGNAPFYIVTRLLVAKYENGTVLFVIGSDE